VKSPFDGYDKPLSVWSNGLEERFWRCFQVVVQQHFPRLAQDADVHGAGMPVNITRSV
jgi:hypothetical protein